MGKRWITVAVGVLGIAFWAAPAYAMHISEGILPIDWASLWFLVAAPFVYGGLRTIKRRRGGDPRAMTLVAMVGAAIFVISCMPIPVPFAGTCSHPCGTGLGALLIGPGPTVVVASIALVFQALVLAHGGLTTLGANIVSMGVVGAFGAYGLFHFLRRMRVPIFAAALAAGIISDWATYATTSLELSSALHGDGSFWSMFGFIMAAFVPTQLPLGIAEGVVTALAYRFVLERRPDLLGAHNASQDLDPDVACDDRLRPDLLEVHSGSQQITGADA
jgi:cobalt/nickel transport system permease protein